MIGCREQGVDAKDQVKESEENKSVFKTGSEVLPGLMDVDSLQILYYDDPYGDPKRYSRYFKYVSTSDEAVVRPLLSNLNSTFELKQNVTECRSQGKIFLFNDGQPLKTVYFSAMKDSCSYLYFIKDGLFYEFDISGQSVSILDSQKKKALVPVADLSNTD